MSIFLKYPYQNFSDYNLDWVINTVKTYTVKVDNIDSWIEQHKDEYAELKAFYDDVLSGNFPDSIKNAFYMWMEKNAINLVGSLVKNVFFGLTDSGYFVAYIPESWEDITFETTEYDMTTELMPEYGHLVLSY